MCKLIGRLKGHRSNGAMEAISPQVEDLVCDWILAKKNAFSLCETLSIEFPILSVDDQVLNVSYFRNTPCELKDQRHMKGFCHHH